MALTDSKIKAAKPLAMRYRISDGHGLALEVMPSTGGRFFRYRYKLGGKENLYTLGEWTNPPYGETTEQAEARRNACAIFSSSRRGLSAQTLANAQAVERLIPA